MSWLLLIHAACTLTMTGVIWFVQTVHYPLFRYAARQDFPVFASSHQRRTGRLVLPLMSIELVSALMLPFSDTGATGLAIFGLLLLVAIWLSTALIQVPLHRRLALGFDDQAVSRLVRSNWLRTLAWSLRSIVALTLLAP